MKKVFRYRFLLILVLAGLAVSCEEVIDLKLKNAEPRLVIDAVLQADAGTCTVEVTRSSGFYQNDSLRHIAGASVELIMDSGIYPLQDIGNGKYFADKLTVVEGSKYELQVGLSADEVYTATTRAPYPVRLDSLRVKRGFGDPRPTSPPIYVINPVWQDPLGIANYYRFKVTTNGKPQTGSFTITSDEQFDGALVDIPLFRYSFSIGDTVRLEFLSIDSVSFSYYTQINDMARPSFVSATPYNPIGNFDNGALGYFGIFFTETRDLVVSGGK